MESRVTKNKQLYEQLQQDSESDLSNSSLRDLSEKLHDLDQEQFSPVGSFRKQPDRVSLHADKGSDATIEASNKNDRDSEKMSLEEAFDQHPDVLWDTFENAYLDEFLQEVKQYNVRKGYRNVADTRANIMTELQTGKKQPEAVITPVDKQRTPDPEGPAATIGSEIRAQLDEMEQTSSTSPAEPTETDPVENEHLEAEVNQPHEDVQEKQGEDDSLITKRDHAVGDEELPLKPQKNEIREDSKTSELPVFAGDQAWEILHIKPATSPKQTEAKQSLTDALPQIQKEASDPIKTVDDAPADEKKTADPQPEPVHEQLQAETPVQPPLETEKPKTVEPSLASNKLTQTDLTATQQLQEVTTRLETKVSEYQDGVAQVIDNVRHTSKLLNFVIYFLFLVLILLIILFIYWTVRQ